MSLGEFFPEVFKADYARRNLEVGSVLKLYVKDTKPPKEKRFIIAGKNIDGLCLATVYINSEINENINYFSDKRISEAKISIHLTPGTPSPSSANGLLSLQNTLTGST